jgi:hypothetical protein
MPTYDDTQSMFDARQLYFDRNGFDGSYAERWVKLQAGPINFYFPNAPGRVRAVKLHDLHHIATGYDTTWTGEAEIGAWEIAGGCGRFIWAWGLNLSAFAVGLAIAPRAVVRAFVRGRHSRNLYGVEGGFREALLRRSVGDVRHTLDLDQSIPSASTRDMLALAVWTAASLVFSLCPIATVAYLLTRL